MNNKIVKIVIVSVMLIIVLVYFVGERTGDGDSSLLFNDKAINDNYDEDKGKKELSYNQFLNLVERREIKTANIREDGDNIKGLTREDRMYEAPNPKSSDLREKLLIYGVEVNEYKGSFFGSSGFMIFLRYFIILIVVIFVVRFIVRRYVGGSIGGSVGGLDNNKFNVVERVGVNFEDIAGNEEAKENLMEVVDFLNNKTRYISLGAKIPRGTILYGPPGTGKTMMAKALAGTAGVGFISITGSDFVEKFVGVGAKRVRDLFKKARELRPCIIFIDEIEAIGRERQFTGGGSEEASNTLNQLLSEMDGFSSDEGIVVVAATNKVESLDSALLRSGRFDRHIQVLIPDIEARYEILKVHSKNKPLDDDVDLYEVAKITLYMTGADLANLMNESSIYAAKEYEDKIKKRHIERAFNKILTGEEKKRRDLCSSKEKEVTAYHESGHALVAMGMLGEKVNKVSIIPTTRNFGGFTLINQEEKGLNSKRDMLKQVYIALGGRASEELVFGDEDITTGAGQDLKHVTKVVAKMVTEYGMGKDNLVNIEELKRMGLDVGDIQDDIKRVVDESYKEVKNYLNKNKKLLFDIAERLKIEETLSGKELKNILNGTNENEDCVLREDYIKGLGDGYSGKRKEGC